MEALNGFLQHQGLTVSTDPKKGRCLFTTKDFHPGEVIISQDPYVFVPDKYSTNSVCHYCFAVTEVKKCAACQYVWYCSVTCQKLDWKLHRLECRGLSSLERHWHLLVRPSIRLMVRLYIRRKLQSEKVIPTTAVDNHDLVEALVTHLASIGAEQLLLYVQIAKVVNAILPWTDIQETAEKFSKLACNNTAMLDSEMEPLGMGLYPVIAIINHSCVPNSVLVFEGKLAVVRAVQHIPRGSEVLISYIDTSWTTMTRQEKLRENYYFTCTCPRCIKVGQFDDVEDIAAFEGYHCPDDGCNGILLRDSVDNKDSICQQCGRARKVEDDVKLLRKMTSMLAKAKSSMSSDHNHEALSMFMVLEKQQRKVCHPLSIYLMQTRDGLIKNLVQQRNWQEGLEYCRLTIPVYERVYPGFHPLLGLRYYLCGKLEWLIGERENAIKSLTKAVDILRVTHGTDTPFMKDLFMKLEKAHAGASNTVSASDMVKLRKALAGLSTIVSQSDLEKLAKALTGAC